jgi:hypothetical protein
LKVWIDLSNSPHPLLFAPIARRLEADGHRILITARDNAQTVALARERWPETDVIGDESPKSRASKLLAIRQRVADLRSWAAGTCPDVALSHNSYAQIVAARTLRIPAVTAMDFEHQPANHLAFRLARTILLPEVLPLRPLRQQGASPSKIVRYPGLKEELYIGDFEPDPDILRKVGIETRPRTVVLARTPPSRAIYHPSENPLFADALRTICLQPSTVCIALTRHPEQVSAIASLGLSNCLIPSEAVDSRSLMYAADVMIGAGGTMTREAALMGIPAWTLFAGKAPTVDIWLERSGRLSRLTDAGQLARLSPRAAEPHTPQELRERGEAIERVLVDATIRTATAI